MAIMFEENLRTASVENVAAKMMLAARTAPKGRGIDNLVIALAKKDDIKNIVHEMQRLSQLSAAPIMAQTLVRDAANVALADAVVLLGTKIAPLGLPECGICGFATCQEKNQHPNFPCAFNTGDLGIAIGPQQASPWIIVLTTELCVQLAKQC